ncbi:hypothetical protein B0H13DRAFT_1963316 [Mycena leptocephala]|nr:hypothetical protein B0H13DRAFT_1963316 [Mycena leptocephala]
MSKLCDPWRDSHGRLATLFCLGFVLALGLKYWEEYAEDSIRKRAFVLTVVFLSLRYWKIINLDVAVFIIWPFLWTDFFLNGAICSMCEAFYIRRCWKMTGKSPWALYPMMIIWFSVVGAQFYILDPTVEKLFRDVNCDVFSYWVIGCTSLNNQPLEIETGLETSNSVVHRVILLTLETALFQDRLHGPGRTSLARWSWDQDQQKQEATGRPDFVTSKLTRDPATTLRGSVESSAPTYNSQLRCEGIAPDEVSEGPSAGHRVHFGSPILDQYERGSYARLRVSSIHRPKPHNVEHP